MSIANVLSTFFTIVMITNYPIKTVQGKITPEFIELTKNSEYWRFMLVLPVCFSILGAALSLYYIRSDSPKALLSKGKTDEAL
jgi:hypothetical protein